MFNVVKNFKKILILPALVFIAGIVFGIINGGFATDINFAGGTEITIDMEKEFSTDEVKKVVKDTLGFDADMVQTATDETAEYQVVIKTKTLDADQRDSLYNAMKEKYALTKEKSESLIKADSITPLISSEIVYNALLAVAIASILILIYITIRFTFTSGIAAIVMLLHDVLFMICVYLILNIPVNDSFIASILTIIGYSINNTIVVFDRIRENKKFAKKETFGEICEKSIWQTARRTINTSGTTLVTLIVLAILGEDSIRQFVIPLIIGVIAGTYSSLFMAAPTWNLLEGGNKKQKKA